jgi:hypothetical protein
MKLKVRYFISLTIQVFHLSRDKSIRDNRLNPISIKTNLTLSFDRSLETHQNKNEEKKKKNEETFDLNRYTYKYP